MAFPAALVAWWKPRIGAILFTLVILSFLGAVVAINWPHVGTATVMMLRPLWPFLVSGALLGLVAFYDRHSARPEDKIDAQMLQARWVLGDLTNHELVNQAALALKQGFDGTALRLLAGLVKPDLRDVGDLPEGALARCRYYSSRLRASCLRCLA